jgi:4-amino-4-deoxy-L-arabinose transferase-like glycosyltransferase
MAGEGREPGLSRGRIVALVVLLAVLLGWHAGDGWRYLHDDNGRRYTSYARTHLTLGVGTTHGRDYFYNPRRQRLRPYGHHPPTLGLLLAGWFRATGHDGPLAARVLPAVFHLASAVLVFGLLRAQYPGVPGLLGALAFAVVPMSSFFGKLVNFEPIALPFLLGATICWWRWTEGGVRRFLAGALALLACAVLIDWPALVAAVVLALDGLRRWRRGDGRVFLAAAAGVAGLALVVGSAVAAWAIGGQGAGELVTATAFRVRLGADYPWWRLVGKVIEYNRRYCTEPLLLAGAGAGVAAAVDAWRGRPFSPRRRLLVLLGVVGGLPVVLFPTSARYHAYWQFYLLPYQTLALAWVLDRLGARVGPRLRRAGWVVVALWLVVASALTLQFRYTHPSGFVREQLASFQYFL